MTLNPDIIGLPERRAYMTALRDAEVSQKDAALQFIKFGVAGLKNLERYSEADPERQWEIREAILDLVISTTAEELQLYHTSTGATP